MREKPARATLVAAVVLSSLTVWAVHSQQIQERETMFQGVLKDDERRREKMRQRQADLDESRRKRETYGKVQTVHNSGLADSE